MSCARPNTPRSNPKDVGELDRPLRDRIHTAMHDAPTGGLVLVSGFRDPGRQWDLRHARCPGRECNRACRGYPETAVPYASKHQKRKAADMGGRDLQWLINHRHEYGLGLTVSSENWHFEAEGIDVRTKRRIGNPTRRILTYGGGDTILRTGSRGPAVEFLQGMLNILWKLRVNANGKPGGRQIAVDGVYGDGTRAAVAEFQRFARAMQQLAGARPEHLMAIDGVAGPATLAAVAFWVPIALRDA